MRKLKESPVLRLVLLVLASVSIAFTISVGTQAIAMASWGAFHDQTSYLRSMTDYMAWSLADAEWAYANRYWFLYGACGLLVFSLLLVFLLISSCGHKKGEEGIVLRWQDRIPFDLYGFAAACLETAFACLMIAGMEYSWSPQSLIGLMGFASIPLTFAGLHALVSIANRLKAGKWWRNTLIFKCCAWLAGLVKRCIFGVNQTGSSALGAAADFLQTLPLVWKVLAAVGVVFLANLFFAMNVFGYGGGRGIMLLLWVLFDGVVVVMLTRILKQLLILKDGAERIAGGDMDFQIDTEGMPSEMKAHGETLNSISSGLSKAVEQRMKSERMKTELITNVSHDIKTPLTSIINYVDLLQKEIRGENRGQTVEEYLGVLSRQSSRLKRLIENLVEASKASTGNIAVNLQRLDICEFMQQVTAEYMDRLAECQLRPVVSLPEGELYVMADGRLLWRVFDNLLNNICKYALAGTRVYIDVHRQENEVQIVFKNISRECLNIDADELMERFVRGDSSRNTEGSGLGLSIAQSLTQSQKGTFQLFVDGDLFKAVVCFRAAEGEV